ncbi:hypothetical protein C8J56DRAFT_1054393 [Mycena floridula]|nr:hypothetical protein C8J56DRAFT_1054393 [Mycena floridula]
MAVAIPVLVVQEVQGASELLLAGKLAAALKLSTYGSSWSLGLGWCRGVGGAYLHDSEYGQYGNTGRPGGVMTYAIFPSNTGTTTFRLVADTTTVSDLIHDITSACSSSLNKATISTSPIAFKDTDISPPKTRISYRILPCQQCRSYT